METYKAKIEKYHFSLTEQEIKSIQDYLLKPQDHYEGYLFFDLVSRFIRLVFSFFSVNKGTNSDL